MGRRIAATGFAAMLLLGGCAQMRNVVQTPEKLAEPVERVAVAPFERDPVGRFILPDAERIVAAQIYGVLAEGSRFRAVADLAVGDASAKVNAFEDPVQRARALGREVEADAVFIGKVSRFVERVGNAYGSDKPASVGFEIQLISVSSGEALWSGHFDQTQQDLSSNLFNWWQFWRAGPRWFTAAELSRLGVEQLLEELERKAP